MNGQKPVKMNWKNVAEEIAIAINNTEITLELQKAQLKEARAHSRGK